LCLAAKQVTVKGTSEAIEKERHVLNLTENASTVVKNIVDHSGNDQEAGLRISQESADSPALNVMPTEAPLPGDQILEDKGARVFLEETAAVTLDDKILDAQVDESGEVQFSLGSQES